MKRISDVIDRVLAGLNLIEPIRRQAAVDAWPQVVGENLAGRTRVVQFNGRTLIVSVPEAALRNELTLRMAQLVRKYHQLGYTFIREIKFVR